MVGVIGNLQLQTLGLGSGVYGTHIVNTLTTLTSLWIL